jgi:hypothetical protein
MAERLLSAQFQTLTSRPDILSPNVHEHPSLVEKGGAAVCSLDGIGHLVCKRLVGDFLGEIGLQSRATRSKVGADWRRLPISLAGSRPLRIIRRYSNTAIRAPPMTHPEPPEPSPGRSRVGPCVGCAKATNRLRCPNFKIKTVPVVVTARPCMSNFESGKRRGQPFASPPTSPRIVSDLANIGGTK